MRQKSRMPRLRCMADIFLKNAMYLSRSMDTVRIEAIKEAVRFNHISIQDIDWFIPHQANLRMFQNISKSLKIPFDKFYLTIHKYGNISSASCAISLDEAVRTQCIKPGQLICLPVFGGGLTWGSALIRW